MFFRTGAAHHYTFRAFRSFFDPLLIVLPGQWAKVIELARRRVGHCAVWFVSGLGLRGEGNECHHDGQSERLLLERQHLDFVAVASDVDGV